MEPDKVRALQDRVCVKNKKLSVNSILLDEITYCATGTMPGDARTLDQEIFEARLVTWNARKSEALLTQGECHPLQAVRTLLSRGHLQEAESILNQLSFATHDPMERIEIALERARLHCFSGQWTQAKKICDKTLALGVSGVSLLTFHSARSVANYELGNFDFALKDLEKLELLHEIYPHTVFKLYAQILGARILARQKGVEDGKAALSKIIESLRSQAPRPQAHHAGGGFTADNVLTILRAQSDMAFLSGQEASPFALASAFMAERIGDPVYRDLGMLEFRVAQNCPDLRFSSYARVNVLAHEILTGGKRSTTAQTMASRYKPSGSGSSGNGIDSKSLPRCLVLKDLKVVVDLERLQFVSYARSKRLQETIHVLSQGPASKEDLFRKIWAPQKYSGNLHASLIRVLLSRLRKELMLPVLTKNGIVTFEEVFVA